MDELTEDQQKIIDALAPEEVGRDGLKHEELARATGLGYRLIGALRPMLGKEVLVCTELDWDPASETDLPCEFYYLPMYEVKVQGQPMALPASVRHDCKYCLCHLPETAPEVIARRVERIDARTVSRVQEGILRTLRRKGPMTLAQLRRDGFKARDRGYVDRALADMAELGVVLQVEPGVWGVR